MNRTTPTYTDEARAKNLADASLLIIAALALGVGLVSSGVLRHLVQTAPSWLTIYFGLRRRPFAKWTALPTYLFWLLLMVLIWLYLLGWARIVTGHFTLIEIAMTIIVATASGFGIVQSLRIRSATNWLYATLVLLSMSLLQLAAFRLSQLPGIANR